MGPSSAWWLRWHFHANNGTFRQFWKIVKKCLKKWQSHDPIRTATGGT
jgi:hypothetical protein